MIVSSAILGFSVTITYIPVFISGIF